jgi:hypothetical protein
VRPHGNVLVGLAGRAIGKRDRVIPTPDPRRTFRTTRLGHSTPHRAGLSWKMRARFHFDRAHCLTRAWGGELTVSRRIVNDRETFLERLGDP